MMPKFQPLWWVTIVFTILCTFWFVFVYRQKPDVISHGDEQRVPKLFQKSSRTVLVTGALGCIGPEVVKQLFENKFDVTVLDVYGGWEVLGDYASRVRFIQGDIRDNDLLKEILPSVSGVVNLAAMSRVSWCSFWAKECMDINVRGTRSLVDEIAAQRHKPWFIQASSREVYGNVTVMPVSESTNHMARNVYGQSKIDAEKVVQAAVQKQKIAAIIIRFSNVYGSRMDHEDRVIPNFIKAALSGEPLAVAIGKGSKEVDFTFVSDAAQAVLLAAQKLQRSAKSSFGVCEDINIGSGESSNLHQVAEAVLKISGSSSKIVMMKSDPMFVDQYSTLLNKARQRLGYNPRVSLQEGLKSFWEVAQKDTLFPGESTNTFRDAISQSLMLRLYQLPIDVRKLTPKTPKIVIIGAGICGICAAIRLQELGHTNFEILEGSGSHGGLASSYIDEKGFTWDIGVHVLFSHFNFFDTLLDNQIKPKEWA